MAIEDEKSTACDEGGRPDDGHRDVELGQSVEVWPVPIPVLVAVD